MMADQLISVIVPAFNAGEHLRRCIDSVLDQTHATLELIVVDDCSTDDTAGILDRRAASDPRLKVLHLPANVGIHAARTAGLRVATGSHIGFVDADDWIAPEMYATLLRAANDDDADIAICGALVACEGQEPKTPKVRFRRRRVFTTDLLERFCRMDFGSGVLWNKLYRADILLGPATHALERRVDASEDYIVNVGCFAAARRVVTLPVACYYYFTRPTSASRAGTGSKHFVRLITAYVACLETYAGSLRPRFHLIDLLYARQLRLAGYTVSSPSQLQACEAELRDSLQRLALVHPTGIYALAHAFDPRLTPRRSFPSAARECLASTRSLLQTLWPGRVRESPSLRINPSKS